MTTITQTSRDHSPAQLKEGKHTNCTTKKVTGVKNHWSLISLNVNGINLMSMEWIFCLVAEVQVLLKLIKREEL